MDSRRHRDLKPDLFIHKMRTTFHLWTAATCRSSSWKFWPWVCFGCSLRRGKAVTGHRTPKLLRNTHALRQVGEARIAAHWIPYWLVLIEGPNRSHFQSLI